MSSKLLLTLALITFGGTGYTQNSGIAEVNSEEQLLLSDDHCSDVRSFLESRPITDEYINKVAKLFNDLYLERKKRGWRNINADDLAELTKAALFTNSDAATITSQLVSIYNSGVKIQSLPLAKLAAISIVFGKAPQKVVDIYNSILSFRKSKKYHAYSQDGMVLLTTAALMDLATPQGVVQYYIDTHVELESLGWRFDEKRTSDLALAGLLADVTPLKAAQTFNSIYEARGKFGWSRGRVELSHLTRAAILSRKSAEEVATLFNNIYLARKKLGWSGAQVAELTELTLTALFTDASAESVALMSDEIYKESDALNLNFNFQINAELAKTALVSESQADKISLYRMKLKTTLTSLGWSAVNPRALGELVKAVVLKPSIPSGFTAKTLRTCRAAQMALVVMSRSNASWQYDLDDD